MRMELVTHPSDPAAAHALDDSQTLTLEAAGDPAAAALLPPADAPHDPEPGSASTPCTWRGFAPPPLTLTF